MKPTIENFVQSLKKDLEINFKIGIKDNFLENKKWDSLLNMGLLAHLDSEYNVILEYDDLIKLNSLLKIYNEVLKRI